MTHFKLGKNNVKNVDRLSRYLREALFLVMIENKNVKKRNCVNVK